MNPKMKLLNPPAMVLLMLFCSVNVLAKSLIDSVVDPIVEEIVYIGSGQCETVKKLERAAYDQFKERPDLSNLSLVQITPEVTTTYNLTSLSKLPSSDSFKSGRPVIIFLHGYTKSPTAPPSVRVREAFQNEDVNFYLLNASQYIGCCNYPRATTMARFVGEALGEALVDLIQADVDAAMIHLIGHSLGAHMAGIAGSTVISTINKQVGRITGLDPALPCFDGAPAEIRLSEDDAAYVDAIHTDSGVLGSNMNLGHADYWPNDGDRSSQPGCDDDSCAHASVCNLFAITVANQTRFPAYSCSNWKEFSNGNCDNNEISYMGYGSKPGTTGTFYLKTDDSTAPPENLADK